MPAIAESYTRTGKTPTSHGRTGSVVSGGKTRTGIMLVGSRQQLSRRRFSQLRLVVAWNDVSLPRTAVAVAGAQGGSIWAGGGRWVVRPMYVLLVSTPGSEQGEVLCLCALTRFPACTGAAQAGAALPTEGCRESRPEHVAARGKLPKACADWGGPPAHVMVHCRPVRSARLIFLTLACGRFEASTPER